MMRIIAFRSPRSLTSSINGWNYDYTDFADRSWWRAVLLAADQGRIREIREIRAIAVQTVKA
jgi:hypothetical protein